MVNLQKILKYEQKEKESDSNNLKKRMRKY